MLLWIVIHTLLLWWVTCRWFWRQRRMRSTPKCYPQCPWYTLQQQSGEKRETMSILPKWTRIFLCNRLQTLQQHLQNKNRKVITHFAAAAAAAAKSLQSCPTLCDPMDGSPSGSPASGILQARTLEWVAFSFSNAWKWKVKVKSLSHAWLLATQAPLSMGFSRQEYWSGLPLPSPRMAYKAYNITMQFFI